MYSTEEINKQFNETTDNVKRWFLISQILTNNWIQLIRHKERETISDEEYYERLIFSSFFIFKSVSPNEENEKQKFMSNMFVELMLFSTKFGHFEDKIGGCFSNDMVQFLVDRYSTIESETKKMNKDNKYTTPFLIYNLYINPTNLDKHSIGDIFKEIGSNELLKQSLLFKATFKFFFEMLEDILQTVREN